MATLEAQGIPDLRGQSYYQIRRQDDDSSSTCAVVARLGHREPILNVITCEPTASRLLTGFLPFQILCKRRGGCSCNFDALQLYMRRRKVVQQ